MTDAVEPLRNALTTVSVCLSPSVAWFTFASAWNQRIIERRSQLHGQLVDLESELKHIGTWARSEYTADLAHSDEWRNPMHRVNDFPTDRLRVFNVTAQGGEVSAGLAEALLALESSVARFRQLLQEQDDFVSRSSSAHLLKVIPQPALASGAPGKESTVAYEAPPGWFDRLYEKNKAVHVKGIGNSGDPGSLHATWTRARDLLSEELKARPRSSFPPVAWIGHVLAALLFAIGVGFLIYFFWLLYWAA